MRKALISAFIILGMMCGCHDDVDEISTQPSQELSEAEQVQIETMQQLQSVLLRIIKDKAVRDEIIAEASETYDGDTDAYMSRLLHVDNDEAKASSAFAKAFQDVVASDVASGRVTDNEADLEQQILDHKLVIYAPYYDEFDWDALQEVTITYHPLIRDDSNEGLLFDLEQEISEVVGVDDAYAFEHPTLIIKPAEAERVSFEKSNAAGARTNSTTIQQLSVGWVKCTRQYDGLFGGGSEFKFCIIGGKVDEMTEAQSFESIVSINLRRKDIRKENWKKFYYELDDNWVAPEDSRMFGLIEFDKNSTEHELNFSAKVKIQGLVETLAEYTITIESKEGWIKTDTYSDRTSFAAFNQIDMGQGVKDNYRIYKSGSVQWTLPLREFTAE